MFLEKYEVSSLSFHFFFFFKWRMIRELKFLLLTHRLRVLFICITAVNNNNNNNNNTYTRNDNIASKLFREPTVTEINENN